MDRKINLRYVLGISLVSALGGFLFGYDWVVIGGAKFFYERYFHISGIPQLQGLAMSGALLGCIPGALFAGYWSDRFGRRKSLITSALLFVVSAVLTGSASTFPGFMIYRIVGGIGIGIASCISPVYIAEIAPRQMRGKLVSLNQLNIVIGILAAQLVNYLIAREVPENATSTFIVNSWNGQLGWRWMFWAECIPALLFFILAIFIPESPRWQVKMEQEDRASDTLRKIGGDQYASGLLDQIRESVSGISIKIDYRFLKEIRIRPILLVGVVLAFFQQWCGINIVFNYAEEVFSSAGFGISDSLMNIVVTGLVNLCFTVVAMRTVDALGRRKLMLIGAAGLAISYVILGAAYRLGWSGTVVLVIILVSIAIYAMSLAPVTWVVLSEIFPNRVRAAAMAISTTTLWVASALLVLLFPLIREWVNISGAFWIYSFICMLGFFFILSRLPETRGKSLEEIEGLF